MGSGSLAVCSQAWNSIKSTGLGSALLNLTCYDDPPPHILSGWQSYLLAKFCRLHTIPANWLLPTHTWWWLWLVSWRLHLCVSREFSSLEKVWCWWRIPLTTKNCKFVQWLLPSVRSPPFYIADRYDNSVDRQILAASNIYERLNRQHVPWKKCIL